MSAVGKIEEQMSYADDPTVSRNLGGEPSYGSTSDDGSADDDCDPPEDYREYGDWRSDYANSVGMRLYDK